LRHVESRRDDDMDAARARRLQEEEGEVPSEAPALCPSVAAATRYIVAERLKLPGGGAGEADIRNGGELDRGRRRNRPVPMKSRDSAVDGEMEGVCAG
jgi:hypothetical protein